MTNNISVLFGEVIRKYRLQKDISQEELADICGLHRTYISDIELGKRNLSIENIEKIANALQVKLSQVFLEVERIDESV